MDCLRDLITGTILSTSQKEFSDSVMHALSKEVYALDIPFGALYSCSDESPVDPVSGMVASPPPNSLFVKLEHD